MPQGVPLINGVGYSWSQVDIKIGGTTVYGVTALSYGETESKTDVFGAGRYPVERVYGRIVVSSCSITMLMSEVEGLQKQSSTGRLQDLGLFDIVVSFLPPDSSMIVTHVLHNCEFTDNSRTLKQDTGGSTSGASSISVQLALACSHITWNK